jgi:hypothetical protein
MSQINILLLGGIFGLFLGCIFSRSHIKKIIRIHWTPSHSINTVPKGEQVQVTGRVRSELRSIRSPLTQTECVLWRAEVLRLVPSGETSAWESIFSETSVYPFEIEDGTGNIRIYPVDAELILRNDWYYESGLFGSFPPEAEAALARLHIPPERRWRQTEKIRAYEQLVKVDEKIYVMGRIKEQNGTPIISSSKDDFPIMISERSRSVQLLTLYVYTIVRVALPIPFVAAIALLISSYV